jgi:hypothetical protein
MGGGTLTNLNIEARSAVAVVSVAVSISSPIVIFVTISATFRAATVPAFAASGAITALVEARTVPAVCVETGRDVFDRIDPCARDAGRYS